MIFQNFTPWLMLLWIVALFMILIPMMLILWRSLLESYYTAKEKHWSRVMNALGKTLQTIAKETGKLDDILKKVKNEEPKNE